MRILLVALFMALASGAYAQEATQPAIESQPIPAVGQEQRGGTGEQDTAPELSYTERLLTAVERIEPAVRELIAEENKVERERQQEREVRDLSAQEHMARWAERMGWAAIASIILTAVGVLLIWRTLLHTRDAAKHAGAAVDEAKKATVAAEETVQLTRTIGQEQVRAYVGLNVLYVSKMQDTGISRDSMKITNFGQSPALSVVIWCKLVDTAPDIFTYEDGEFLAENITIRPAQDVPVHWTDKTEDKNLKFLYGYIEYSDIHRNRWRARFAKRHRGGDWYTYHHEHNDEIQIGGPPPT